MKIIKRVCMIIMTLSIFMTVLITSIEIAAYSDWGFYQREYEKNEVLDDVHMEMGDLMDVTREMMKYLRGDREDLVIITNISGEKKEFFNDREKIHMADCRVLFVSAIWLRRICMLLIAATILIICAIDRNGIYMRIRYIAGKLWRYLLGVIGAVAVLFGIIAVDFDKAFITFHHIFFNNDMWLLDPDTDNLINIVPQTFFSDMCIRIGIIFGIFMILIFSMAIIAESVIIKKLNSKNNQ